ncbi:MAG: 23S rRNA (uracil(1939)-C(5))-methyltransferase RlmD [Pseudomonadota bacterium]
MGRRRALKTPPVTLQGTIESFSHDGRGVARVEGKTVFVRDALPGEEVSFTVTRSRKNYDEARLEAVLEASPQRVDPRCAHFGTCGGCSLQHLDLDAQIEFKEQGLRDALTHIGGVEPEEWAAPLRSEPWGYRRKARLGAKFVRRHGRVFVGFRERGSGFLADVRECTVLHPKVGRHLAALGEFLTGLSIREQVPQVEMAMGDDTCVMVFRLLAPLAAGEREALKTFCEQRNWTGYLQPGGPDSLEPLSPDAAPLLYSLREEDLAFEFRPTDFTQVNLEVNRRMVAQAMEWLAPQRGDRILDLFCGLGNFTLPLARRCEEAIGVEGDAGLVARARENAAANRIDNARFFTENLYEEAQPAAWLKGRYNAVLLDPPRTGAMEILGRIKDLGAGRVLYVSCYPGTLARDAAVLVGEQGYRLVRAGVMDMFPHTSHVESMALFHKD